MRRALALLLVVPLACLGGTLTTPARAGDNTYVVVRALDDRFEEVGETCAGEPAGPPELAIGLSDIHYRGQGSMRVSAVDTLGGVLVEQPKPLRGVMWPVWTPADSAMPQGQWRVEMNGEVLASTAVDLTPGAWQRVDLEDAVLSNGSGWTGSIEDYVAEFGKGDTWAAGFLTGGCLASPEARVDVVGTRKAGYDFEARTWVSVRVRGPNGGNGATLASGQRFVLTATAQRYSLDTDTAQPVEGAHLRLLRRWSGIRDWEGVLAVRTGPDGVARFAARALRASWWRAVWIREPNDVPSDPAFQSSNVVLGDPAADGAPCRLRPSTFPPTCRTITVDRGTVTLSGSGRPPGAATLRAQVHAGGPDGPVIATKTVRLRQHGWTIDVATGARDRLTVEVTAQATSRRHFVSGTWLLPLRVH
jgi:hypothetical protein